MSAEATSGSYALNPDAFRLSASVPSELLERCAPDVAEELSRSVLEKDTILAAVDSALVTNPQVLKVLSDLQSEGARDPTQTAPPFPLLEDYVSDESSPSRVALEKTLSAFAKHFDLEQHLRSRAFRQNLGALRRPLGPTEAALIKAAARAWWEDSPANDRWKNQGALIHTPDTVVGIALSQSRQETKGRRPVLAIYNTADSGKLLRILVAKEAELMAGVAGYRQPSVAAAPSLPDVFATLRFRRRSNFFVSEAPSDVVARAAAAAVAELTARRTARRGKISRSRRPRAAESVSTADSVSSWASFTPSARKDAYRTSLFWLSAAVFSKASSIEYFFIEFSTATWNTPDSSPSGTGIVVSPGFSLNTWKISGV